MANPVTQKMPPVSSRTASRMSIHSSTLTPSLLECGERRLNQPPAEQDHRDARHDVVNDMGDRPPDKHGGELAAHRRIGGVLHGSISFLHRFVVEDVSHRCVPSASKVFQTWSGPPPINAA